MTASIVTFLCLVFAFGLVSHRLERTVVTGPMVFTIGGLIVASFMAVEDRIDFDLEGLLWPAKIALAVEGSLRSNPVNTACKFAADTSPAAKWAATVWINSASLVSRTACPSATAWRKNSACFAAAQVAASGIQRSSAFCGPRIAAKMAWAAP